MCVCVYFNLHWLAAIRKSGCECRSKFKELVWTYNKISCIPSCTLVIYLYNIIFARSQLSLCRRSFWRGKKARVTTREVLSALCSLLEREGWCWWRSYYNIQNTARIRSYVDGVYCVHSIYIYYARRLLLLAYHISQQLSYYKGGKRSHLPCFASFLSICAQRAGFCHQNRISKWSHTRAQPTEGVWYTLNF